MHRIKRIKWNTNFIYICSRNYMYIVYNVYCVYELMIIIGLCLFSRLKYSLQMTCGKLVVSCSRHISSCWCLSFGVRSPFPVVSLLEFLLIACDLKSALSADVVVLCNVMWYSSYRFPSYGVALIFGITIPCSFVLFVFLVVCS
jgi:hypothetical protein